MNFWLKAILGIVGVAVLAGLACLVVPLLRKPSPNVNVWSTGPTIQSLESLSQLVSTKVNIADVLIAESKHYRGSWLIKGDALIGIDLKRASIAHSDAETRKAKLRLPLPCVIMACIDHERSRSWSIETKGWLTLDASEGDVMRDKAMRQAQKLVEFAAGADETITTAKKTTEGIIRQMYDMVGWTIEIEWIPE